MNQVYQIVFENKALGKSYRTQMEAESEEMVRLQFSDHYAKFCQIKSIEKLNQTPRTWEVQKRSNA